MAKQKRTFNSDIVRSQGENWLLKYDKTERMYSLVAELSGYGLLDAEISKLFSIDYRRFAELKAGDDDLKNALEIGRARATANVTKALYNKCVGYVVDETTDTVVTDESDGSTKHTVSVKTKHIAPSDNAIIFWLSNKAGDSWKQSQKVSIGRSVDEVDLSKMTPTELAEYINQMKQRLAPKNDVALPEVSDD